MISFLDILKQTYKKCTKCGSFKDKEQDFYFKYKKQKIKESMCKSCRNIVIKNYSNQKKINVDDTNDVIWNILINSKCEDCDISDPLVLEFDHINPDDKIFEISVGKNFSSIKKILTEINKCRILCANCHQIRTHKQLNSWKYKMSLDVEYNSEKN